MYSSVFFFSGTYCTVSCVGLLVCVSALWGGTLVPLMNAGKTGEWTQSDSYQLYVQQASLCGPQDLSTCFQTHETSTVHCLLWDRFSLHSPWFVALDWLGTHCVDPAGLELVDLPASAFSAGIRGKCHYTGLKVAFKWGRISLVYLCSSAWPWTQGSPALLSLLHSQDCRNVLTPGYSLVGSGTVQ